MSRAEAVACWQCGLSFGRATAPVIAMNRTTIPLLFIVAFASGAALGLNIHPPNQNELEKGYKAGYAKGQAVGGAAGFTRGQTAGMTNGRRIGYQAAQDEITRNANVLRKQITKIEQVGSNNMEALKAIHKGKLARVRSEAYSKGRAEASGKLREEHRTEIVELKSRHRIAVTLADERGYQRGLSEDGYAKGRDSGLKEGFNKASEEAVAVCDSRVRIAATTARDAGLREGKKKGNTTGKRDAARDCEYQIAAAVSGARTAALAEGKTTGIKDGERTGFAKGERQGYDDGHKFGYVKGRDDGYIRGWEACGCK